MFYALFVCGHYFFNTGLSKSAFFTYYFGELVFLCHELFILIELRHNDDYSIYI